MKKILLGLIALTLTVALSLSVIATEPLYLDDEHPAWELIDGQWSPMGTGSIMANARAWSSEVTDGSCNKESWQIPVSVHASVAQWIEFTLTGSKYVWRVRKPGTYAANSLTATLKSNGDVKIDFEGFGDLQSLDESVKDNIPIWYAAADVVDPSYIRPKHWIRADAMNGIDALVEDSGRLHRGYMWKLWNKIRVVECNSACEYQNDATITLVLQNLKTWINPVTGYFAD